MVHAQAVDHETFIRVNDFVVSFFVVFFFCSFLFLFEYRVNLRPRLVVMTATRVSDEYDV